MTNRSYAEMDDVMPAAEAAKFLGVSRATLTRLEQRGEIRSLPISPVLRWAPHYFKRGDVERLLREAIARQRQRAAVAS